LAEPAAAATAGTVRLLTSRAFVHQSSAIDKPFNTSDSTGGFLLNLSF